MAPRLPSDAASTTPAGIIVLRPEDQRIPTVTDIVETLIDNHPIESLAGCVTVVQRNML